MFLTDYQRVKGKAEVEWRARLADATRQHEETEQQSRSEIDALQRDLMSTRLDLRMNTLWLELQGRNTAPSLDFLPN